MVKSKSMAQAGPDSFWKVSGESSINTQGNLSTGPRRFHEPETATSARSLLALERVRKAHNAPVFDGKKNEESSSDTKSYRNEQRLSLGFLPSTTGIQDAVERLFGEGLTCPIQQGIEYVEIGDEQWLTKSTFVQREAKLYAVQSASKARLPLYGLSPSSSRIALADGIVVFSEQPAKDFMQEADLRSESEITEAADSWLKRIVTSVRSSQADRERIEELRDLLANYVDETVSPAEFDELRSTLKVLEGRQELRVLLPELIRNDGIWSGMIEAQITDEVDERRRELEQPLAEEIASKSDELRRLKSQISDAEAALENSVQRHKAFELALEDFTRRATDLVRAEVESALAKQDASLALSKEISGLSTRLSELEQLSRDKAQTAVVSEHALPVRAPTEITGAFSEIQQSTGLSETELSILLSSPAQRYLPTLLSVDAEEVLVGIAEVLSAGKGASVFLDPTIVSLADLMDAPNTMEDGTLADVLTWARLHPETVCPIALCGIDRSPCEFWLPSLLAGGARRLPKNVVWMASVAGDGQRIEMPRSLLQKLQPVVPSASIGRPKVSNMALWPIFSIGRERVSQGLSEVLAADEFDAALAREAKNMTDWLVATFGVSAASIVSATVQRQNWLLHLHDDVDHPASGYFYNEGM
tara:strand:+ start:11523 stop:13463 length:1941 start_codon:yes stop_codon:yes gene_type:complete